MVKPLINISRKQALIYAAFLVFYEFLTYIANDMIMPGMIRVVSSFHAPESYVANSLTAYILGGASLQIFLGPISDRHGRRPVMLFGVVLFFFCTLAIALSQSIEQFIIARFFQGMGLCFIGVIGYATLQEIFAEVDAVKLIAIMANVSILAPLVGPLLGSIVIHLFSWRWIFVGIAVLTIFSLIGLFRYMPESVGKKTTDGRVIPRVPLEPRIVLNNYRQLFSSRLFVMGSIAQSIIAIPCLCWIGLSPIMLILQEKLTILQYGLWQIPVFSASIIGNWALALLSGRVSMKVILFIGSITAIAGLLLMLVLTVCINASFIWLMPGLILYFFALGMSLAPLERKVLFATPVAKGTASALMTLILMILIAVGIEGGNRFYADHNNVYFAAYCALMAVLYGIALLLTGIHKK
ncbi:MFS transporter [Legionella sp. W05-934-2]|uniref:MFS transporter n=1 Tax=Legionella sp. W05-934-2 TaxID=1198649 RepID=UPI00346327E8